MKEVKISSRYMSIAISYRTIYQSYKKYDTVTSHMVMLEVYTCDDFISLPVFI